MRGILTLLDSGVTARRPEGAGGCEVNEDTCLSTNHKAPERVHAPNVIPACVLLAITKLSLPLTPSRPPCTPPRYE